MKNCPKCGNDLLVKNNYTLVTGKIGYRCFRCGWKKTVK